MNQLQNLLYDSLIRTQHVESAALIKIKEGIAITAPPHFHLQPQQIQVISDVFKNTPYLRREGFNFREKNYKCVRADKNSIYAKCDNEGIVMIKTKTSILFATCQEGMYPSVCVEAAEKLVSPPMRCHGSQGRETGSPMLPSAAFLIAGEEHLIEGHRIAGHRRGTPDRWTEVDHGESLGAGCYFREKEV